MEKLYRGDYLPFKLTLQTSDGEIYEDTVDDVIFWLKSSVYSKEPLIEKKMSTGDIKYSATNNCYYFNFNSSDTKDLSYDTSYFFGIKVFIEGKPQTVLTDQMKFQPENVFIYDESEKERIDTVSIHNISSNCDCIKLKGILTKCDVSFVDEDDVDDWSPNADWYDIDKVLEEDPNVDSAKMICLLKDTKDTLTLPANFANCSRVRTSDGAEYDGAQEIEHTWNKEYDKPCNDGYSTRYVIFYFDEGRALQNDPNFTYIQSTLYLIMDGLLVNSTGNLYNLFNLLYCCECIKIKNVNWLHIRFAINNLKKLKSVRIENSVFQNITAPVFSNCYLLKNMNFVKKILKNSPPNFSSLYQNDYSIKKIELPEDTSNVTNFQNSFAKCISLEKIKGTISLENCTNASGIFSECYKLKNNPIPDGEGKNIVRASNMYNGNFFLKYLDLNLSSAIDIGIIAQYCVNLLDLKMHNTNKVESFRYSFADCPKLKNIDILDFDSATNVDSTFFNCISLQNIDEVRNKKITGLTFTSCPLNHETKLRILNALYDYSGQGGVHQLILGADNLATLSDEEKAIATERGWTLS